MEIKRAGPAIIRADSPYHKFNIPFGAQFLLLNPTSRDLYFEVDISGENDYQFLDEKTGRYVKVDFKKSAGPFKGVPIKG